MLVLNVDCRSDGLSGFISSVPVEVREMDTAVPESMIPFVKVTQYQWPCWGAAAPAGSSGCWIAL